MGDPPYLRIAAFRPLLLNLPVSRSRAGAPRLEDGELRRLHLGSQFESFIELVSQLPQRTLHTRRAITGSKTLRRLRRDLRRLHKLVQSADGHRHGVDRILA